MSKTNQPRQGARFNLFDVILILAIICCIAGIVAHAYFVSDLNERYTENATLSFTISGVSESTANAFCMASGTVYIAENDQAIGTLERASFSSHVLSLENEEGLLVSVTHPAKMDIQAEASITGTWTEDGFLIGGTTLAIVGKTLNIYTEGAVCTITITGVYPQLQKK